MLPGSGGKGNSYSGSTGWHNSVSSRLALADDTLVHEKLNIGTKAGGPHTPGLGRFRRAKPRRARGRTVTQTDAADDAAVLACLRAAVLAGVDVSTAETGPATAWHSLAAFQECPHELRVKEGKPRVGAALMRLVRAGKIQRANVRTLHRKDRERWEVKC